MCQGGRRDFEHRRAVEEDALKRVERQQHCGGGDCCCCCRQRGRSTGAKQCQHHHQQRARGASSSVRTLLTRLAPLLIVLDRAEALALSGGDDVCGICLESWRAGIPAALRSPPQEGDGERAFALCKHVHCLACLLWWLSDGRPARCPVCQTPLEREVEEGNGGAAEAQ